MLLAGTRVYACCSAITGKKLGPKRYSLGYVSDNNDTYYIKYVKNFPIKNQTFMFTPLKIVFTRYGKEEKQRNETRDFLQILPLFDSSKLSDTIPDTIKQIVSVFNGGELSKNTYWRDLCNNYIPDGTHIGTIMPVRHTSAAKMDSKDTEAWMSSILQNREFRALITANKYLQTLKDMTCDIDIFVWLSNAVNKGSARRDLYRWASEEQENTERLATVLRRINIAFNKRMLDQNIKDGVFMLDHAFQANSFLTWLVYGMLDAKKIIIDKIDTVEQAKGTNKENLALIKNIGITRSTYLNLKPKYV
jgi:hypothetical protein